MDISERNRKIIAERASGKLYVEIAMAHGLSLERVRQIWREHLAKTERQERFNRTYAGGITPETPIEDLNLSIRVRNALQNDQIYTVGQLMKIDDRRLMRIPNFGRKSLKEVHEVVNQVKPAETSVPAQATGNTNGFLDIFVVPDYGKPAVRLQVRGACDVWVNLTHDAAIKVANELLAKAIEVAGQEEKPAIDLEPVLKFKFGADV